MDANSDDEADEELPDLEDLPEIIGDDDDGEKAEMDEEEIVNVFGTLTEEEQERWKDDVKPIRSALHKVSY